METLLLLTVFSVLAVWALLGVLYIGLLLILKSLQSVRGWFEKVNMGLWAIEQQTKPLGSRADTVGITLGEAGEAFGAAARGLADADHHLDLAGPALRRHR
jgi:hypothetical protein